jgi:hypothetical protein
MSKRKLMPVRERMCKTCPFHEAGWIDLREFLQMRALQEASPICHSTGKALTKCEGPARVCRGARDFQLMIFHRIGLLSEPTDKAWEAKWLELTGKRK